MPRLLATSLLMCLLAGCSMTGCSSAGEEEVDPPPPPPSLVELRGVWLTNVDSDVLTSRARIAEAMQFLADHHLNVVYPVVWNAARTLYPSQVMADTFGEDARIDARYAGRDPLRELVEEAGRHGIKVIPWFEYGFAASYNLRGGPILQAKPEWAAKDASGNLLTKNGFEWMNGYHPEVQQFILDLVTEVVRTYDVDGVQGDDRLPAQPSEGGYSEVTQALYRAEHGGADPPTDFRDPAWMEWRADRLTAFGERLYDAVKAEDASLQVSWSPSIFPWGYENYLQDWPEWVANGQVDQVIPQNYRYDLAAYKNTLATQRAENLPDGLTGDLDLDASLNAKIYPGVLMNLGVGANAYVIPMDYLMGLMEYNRAQGYGGEVFFFYEGLRKNDDAIADTLLKTFYAEPARPW